MIWHSNQEQPDKQCYIVSEDGRLGIYSPDDGYVSVMTVNEKSPDCQRIRLEHKLLKDWCEKWVSTDVLFQSVKDQFEFGVKNG